ncbi:hypothetical protein ACX0HA_05350 [Flavobacterium hauense]
MKKYYDITGTSGVTSYEIDEESIMVEFNHEVVYRYTYASAGKRTIEKMKRLAAEGKGLSTYISRSVREKYESKLND